MRYLEIICEAVETGQRFYHGTATEARAISILQHGLRPPETVQKTNLSPQAGYVYLTPHLPYAFNYAMGAHFERASIAKLKSLPYIGNEARFRWLFNSTRSWFGFIFVTHAASIERELQPDEDAVGALYRAAKNGHIHFYLESFLPETIYQNAKADPRGLARFVAGVEASVSASVRAKLQSDQNSRQMLGWAAKTGKIALRKMDAATKAWLVEIGCHVGHHGVLVPDECWRFDKRKIADLEVDCSNFFTLADQVR